MSPIEIGLAVAIIAALGWGLSHRAKVAALASHVELLHTLLPKAPEAAPAVAAPASTVVVVPAPTVAAPPVPAPRVELAVPVVAAAAPAPAPTPNSGSTGSSLGPAPAKARNPLSNAPAGYPDTSPSGFPYWYALGGDGKPVGAPVLVYDGNPFTTEGEIAAYRAAVATRNLNLGAYQAPAFVGTIPMSTLSLADWCYIDALGSVNWNAVLAGDADVFRAKTTEAYYNGLASFDPASYAGQLKQA